MNTVLILLVVGYLAYKLGTMVGFGRGYRLALEESGMDLVEDTSEFIEDQREAAEMGWQ